MKRPPHTRTLSTLTVLLCAALAAPRPAASQSWYLDWLKRVEEWSLREDYRGWIFHGAIAAAVTVAADRLAGRAAYGAALSSGFYLGKEFREAALWDGFTTDRVMDMASPVVAAVAIAFLLRGDAARPHAPRILPPPLPAPCAVPPARPREPPPPGPRLPDASSRPWLCLAALDPASDRRRPRAR